jgi:hypothetical protein
MTRSSTKKATKPNGDPLSGKIRPRRVYRIQIAEPTPEQERAVNEARHQHRMALLMNDTQAADTAADEVQAAVAAVDAACWREIVLYSIRPARLTDLLAEHPPTDEQKAEGASVNDDTFAPALIAECAEDLGMTGEQWQAEFDSDRWSTEEQQELYALALELNVGRRKALSAPWML